MAQVRVLRVGLLSLNVTNGPGWSFLSQCLKGIDFSKTPPPNFTIPGIPSSVFLDVRGLKRVGDSRYQVTGLWLNANDENVELEYDPNTRQGRVISITGWPL